MNNDELFGIGSDFIRHDIKKELEEDFKKSKDEILNKLKKAENITKNNPSTWEGAFLVPRGIRIGRSPVNRYVYEEDVPKYWKHIVFHIIGDDTLFYWNPDEITINITQRNIIKLGSEFKSSDFTPI